MIDQFINFVIRPPRAEYNPDQYLWEKEFTLAGRKYKRQDLELRNARGHALQCSHYVPSPFPDDIPLPCVIYCHGNSGCRADANEAAVILLPSNITVFTLDFSGSGLSGGDYVSLGWHEKEDLKVAVSYLRSNNQISCIGLWGRSMGAVTSLLYGAEDPSIAGMVLDSAFSNLFDLMMELVDVYKIRLPKFTVKVAVQYMRRVIQKKVKFDIMDLKCVQVAPKTFIPALFGHAHDDKFIKPSHSDIIFKSYAGDKNIIKFDGDHNSSRPQFYYDSVSIFFYNVLRPPQLPADCSSKVEKYYDLGGLKVGAGMDEVISAAIFTISEESLKRLGKSKPEEGAMQVPKLTWSLLYEIISGLQTMGTDPASSSSAPPNLSTAKSYVGDLLSDVLLSDITPVASNTMVNEDNNTPSRNNPSQLQDKPNGPNEECLSYTSSNRESWGRCSSLGSNDEPSADCSTADDNHQVPLKMLATPLRNIHYKSLEPQKEEKRKKKKKKTPTIVKKSRHEKFEALSQRLRLGILKRVSHRRNRSS